MNPKTNSPTPAVVASLPWVRTAGGAVLNAWNVEVHPNDTVQLSTATLALTARVAELEQAYGHCSIERRDAEHALTAALDRVAELEGALRLAIGYINADTSERVSYGTAQIVAGDLRALLANKEGR